MDHNFLLPFFIETAGKEKLASIAAAMPVSLGFIPLNATGN
jgi:hypothetical protein